MLPLGKYKYFTEGQIDFEPCDENEEMEHMLRRLYQRNVLYTADTDICFGEELRFCVKKDVVSVDEKNGWQATLTVFDVRNQEDKTVIFRLL